MVPYAVQARFLLKELSLWAAELTVRRDVTSFHATKVGHDEKTQARCETLEEMSVAINGLLGRTSPCFDRNKNEVRLKRALPRNRKIGKTPRLLEHSSVYTFHPGKTIGQQLGSTAHQTRKQSWTFVGT